MDAAWAAAKCALDAAVVGGVIWPYVVQTNELKRTKDVESFSKLTSLIIVVSSLLRILYFISLPAKERFGLPLFIQAIANVTTQLWFMNSLLDIKENVILTPRGAAIRTRRSPEDKSLFSGHFRASHVWDWDDTISYIAFVLIFFALGFWVSSSMYKVTWYAQLLGGFALGVEALLPVPQLVKNTRRKSTKGLSTVLVGSWLLGDLFKTAYAVLKREPLPFVACGLFQCVCDALLAIQMGWLYPPRHGHGPDTIGQGQGAEDVQLAPHGIVNDGLHRWAEHAAGEATGEMERANRVLLQEGIRTRL